MSNVSKSFRKSLAAIPEASSAECGDKAIFDRLQRPALRANLFLEEGLSAGGVCLAPEHPVHTGEVRVASGHIRHSRGGTLGRVRAGTVIVARGEFNIVIAGLAAGVEPALGPLAAAYVLVMAVAGPILTRVAEPVATRLFGRLPRRRGSEAAPAVAIDEHGDLPER